MCHTFIHLITLAQLSPVIYQLLAHKLAGVNDPTETAIIRQLLKGYRKLAPSHDVRLPITLPILT